MGPGQPRWRGLNRLGSCRCPFDSHTPAKIATVSRGDERRKWLLLNVLSAQYPKTNPANPHHTYLEKSVPGRYGARRLRLSCLPVQPSPILRLGVNYRGHSREFISVAAYESFEL